MIVRLFVVFGIYAMLLQGSVAFGQLPVEFFAGHKKATFDAMFFKFIKNNQGANSPWLFFNRNRATIDYAMTSSANLPQFGFTEAFSFNDGRLKGFAPVAVAQISGGGVYPKAGVQFAYIRENVTFFSWLVSETKERPVVDIFVLARYTPRLGERLHLFSQLELVNAFPTSTAKSYVWIQRLRLGLKLRQFQFGMAGDFSTVGSSDYISTNNFGGFLRYEY